MMTTTKEDAAMKSILNMSRDRLIDAAKNDRVAAEMNEQASELLRRGASEETARRVVLGALSLALSKLGASGEAMKLYGQCVA